MKRLLSMFSLVFVLAAPSLAQERTLSVYGYFDLEYEVGNENDAARRGSFDQHHFNVITSYVLDDHFRVLGEIEWEHGTELAVGEGAGEVKLVRAWAEYRHADGLKIRVGKFLPPYGIYNLRHDATPTFLSTFLPSSIYGNHLNPLGEEQRFYSKHATGIQVLGSVPVRDWRVGYAAYVSNGRGETPFESDGNSNKGLGGRLTVLLPKRVAEIGTSFYTDRNGTAADTRQTFVGFDANIDIAGFNISGETTLGRLETVTGTMQPSGSFQNSLGAYGQLAYTLYDRVTPFARYDFFDPNTGTSDDGEYHVTTGVNFSVTPRVYLKAEVHSVGFQQAGIDSYRLFVASIAVAF
ncbi:MAG: hypothetical protein HKN37_01715 [Rhodothermales bacterium]|nr:hypothetical protein [Rhodothermales bacterium]